MIRLSPFELIQVIWFRKIKLEKTGESLSIIFEKTLQTEGCQRLGSTKVPIFKSDK